MKTTIDLRPTPDGYATIGALFAQQLITTIGQPRPRAAMMRALVDIVRYLAVLDADAGTAHLAAMEARILRADPYIRVS